MQVRDVLLEAASGKGPNPHYLTAHQILDRLPTAIRDQIIAERGMPGRGGGPWGASQVVSDAAQMLERSGDVDIDFLDTRGVTLSVAEQSITPGNQVCGLYRMRR